MVLMGGMFGSRLIGDTFFKNYRYGCENKKSNCDL